MRINRHRWKRQPGFKTWECEKCHAVKHWDTVLERMIYTKHGKQTYHTPPCNSIINCEYVF